PTSSATSVSPPVPYTTPFRSRGLPRLLRPQDAGALGRRRAVGPPGAAGEAAAVPDGRFDDRGRHHGGHHLHGAAAAVRGRHDDEDRKSTRLNSSHVSISYAVF